MPFELFFCSTLNTSTLNISTVKNLALLKYQSKEKIITHKPRSISLLTQRLYSEISTFVILSLTRSRISLPGLKCGTYLAINDTESPVLGFLPVRGGR